MECFLCIDTSQTIPNIGLMVIAYLIALPIGIERQRHGHSAGLRTFSLLSMASCGYFLVATMIFQDAVAQSRVMEGIVTAIGFLGGGAIIKYSDSVSGTSTAASIWATGVIGISVAMRHLDIAAFLSLTTYFTMKFLGNIEPHLFSKNRSGNKETKRNKME